MMLIRFFSNEIKKIRHENVAQSKIIDFFFVVVLYKDK